MHVHQLLNWLGVHWLWYTTRDMWKQLRMWVTRVVSPHSSWFRRAYILPLWFFFLLSFFLSFWHLISEVAERISTKLGRIFTYDCYLKNLVRNLPGIYPHGLEAKKRFLEPTLNFDQTYLCSGTWYQQSESNLSIYRDSLTCPPNLVKFGMETAENGWRVFANVPAQRPLD